MNGLKLFILTIILFLYLLLGALIFHYLEYDHEGKTRLSLHSIRDELLGNFTCLTEQVLQNFVDVVIQANSNGVRMFMNDSSPSNWDFSSSFFFSGTVVTTIGYGNISPGTRGGQSFVIVYAMIGIPLCGLILAQLGIRMNAKFQRLENRLWEIFERHNTSPRLGTTLVMLLYLTVLLVVFIMIPAIVFRAVEGWSYREAVYYCFISLTTIGFGDYVVGTNSDIPYSRLYKWLAYIWIFFGLVAMATIIAKISEWMTGKAEKAGAAKEVGGRDQPDENPINSQEILKEAEREEGNDGEIELTGMNGNH